MAKQQAAEIKVTIICWKCDHKFSILLPIIKAEQVTFLGEDDKKLAVPPQVIRPKVYTVPCPYCGTENDVPLP